ncbi:MAG: DUF3084 domain-containing protein [Bacillota bacterium]
MYGFTLVLMLIVLGGVIAFVGDRIGMKVGRRRLTIFGLRPKHTSMIITVITGIVVSTSSLAVMSMVSKDVRTALFKMREIQTALATTREQLSTAVTQLSVQQEELTAKEARVGELQTQIDTLTGEIDRLSAAANVKAKEYEVLTARNATLAAELEEVKKERVKAQDELLAVQAELGKLKQQYHEMKGQYDETKASYAEAQANLAKANKNIEALQQTEKNLKQTIASLEEKRKQLQAEKNALETYKGELTEQVKLLYSSLQNMSQYLEGLQLSDITYRADEIILATVIEGDRPIEKVRDDVAKFLQKADRLALARSARIEGSDNEAIIFFTDNLDNTAQRIAKAKGPVVVRLVSATNAFVGQPVYAYLQFFENKLIFKQGQVVAEREIDGSLGPDKVQDELMNLLMSANDEATRRGMVTDAEGRVGQAPLSEFNSAKAEILELGRKVRVLAVAVQDTWNTKPPLKVAFQVVK